MSSECESGIWNFIDTPEKHNTVGALVGACDTSASVYVGWNIPFFIAQWRNEVASQHRCVVIFGPSLQVRDMFVDIHRAFGRQLRNVQQRTVTLVDDTQIVFAYLEDQEEAFRGFHFQSVWIVGDRQPREIVRLNEVRSGYRGAVRAQYQGLVEPQINVSDDMVLAQTLAMQRAVDAMMGQPIAEAKQPETPSELIRFPEKRLFLTEGDE